MFCSGEEDMLDSEFVNEELEVIEKGPYVFHVYVNVLITIIFITECCPSCTDEPGQSSSILYAAFQHLSLYDIILCV